MRSAIYDINRLNNNAGLQILLVYLLCFLLKIRTDSFAMLLTKYYQYEIQED